MTTIRAMLFTPSSLIARTRRAVALRIRQLLRLRRVYLIWAELRWVPNESQRLFALTVAIGTICGIAAVAFHAAIQLAERTFIEPALAARGQSWVFWTIATPAVGAAVCGVALQVVVPNARGSGIPQVKATFGGKGSRLRLRDSIGKFIIGALQIGTGSSLGREGPTVYVCAGIASSLGRVIGVSAKNLRRLIPVGAAAGIAAAFNAPIAAVTFTVEEVLGNLDQAMLSGVIAAAALAAVIERSILGEATSVNETYAMSHANSLWLCVLVGLAAAYVSLAFSESLLRVRRFFRSLTFMPEWTRPAVGGLVTGLLAVAALQWMNVRGITGGGYVTLGNALNGALSLRVMLALCAMKLVATVFSYSSGGAGGIFAPSLFVGAMLGGGIGRLAHVFLHGPSDPVGAFALVGMGAVFAGVIRAPVTSVLIVVEMTGSYSLILPLMLANMTSYVVARRMKPIAIYEALLVQDGIHLQPSASRETIDTATVSSAIDRRLSVLSIPSSMPVAKLLHAWHEHRPQDVYPVVDNDGRMVGVITVDDLHLLSSDPNLVLLTTATDLMRPPLAVRPHDHLRAALEAMMNNRVREIPVTDDNGRLLGLIDETTLAASYIQIHDEGAQAQADLSTAR